MVNPRTNTTAHTPGPWTLEPGIGGGFSGMISGPEHSVAAVCNYYPKAVLANALLIAAAPDLLAACEAAIYALKGREHDGFLRAAIAKAKGEEHGQ